MGGTGAGAVYGSGLQFGAGEASATCPGPLGSLEVASSVDSFLADWTQRMSRSIYSKNVPYPHPDIGSIVIGKEKSRLMLAPFTCVAHSGDADAKRSDGTDLLVWEYGTRGHTEQ